jgi:hypothetical protein
LEVQAAGLPQSSDGSAGGAIAECPLPVQSERQHLPDCRYFLGRVLPEAGAHLAKLKSGATPLMALPAEAF